MQKPRPQQSRPPNPRSRRKVIKEKEDKIYFEKAVITETLPGTTFRAKVERQSKDPANPLAPILINCNLKSKLIKNVKIIRGDVVKIEVNPEDMYFSQELGILKGTIIQRLI